MRNRYNRKGTVLRTCQRCRKEYKPTQGRQKFCGSYREGKGCSAIMRKIDHNLRIKKLWEDPKWAKKERARLRKREQERAKKKGGAKRFKHCRCYLCPIHFKVAQTEKEE